MRVILTKKFFFGLPTGIFLQSNCGHNIYSPVFADEVWPVEIRHLQWQIIRDRRANGRLCVTWPSREIFESKYYEQVLSILTRGYCEIPGTGSSHDVA